MVQVPGAANAHLSDKKIAELLNWMLWQISPDQVPDDFVPYDEEEVGRWCKKILPDVAAYREHLIERILSRDSDS